MSPRCRRRAIPAQRSGFRRRASPGRCARRVTRASRTPSYRDLQFLQVFARLIADQIERRSLAEKQKCLERQSAAAETLIVAVAARDSYTAAHSRQVVEHAIKVAKILGLSKAERADLEKVALLHDIGKIGIPDQILLKPGPLTAEEWETMRRHPILSERLIGEVAELEHLGPALRAEHERWDGLGHPTVSPARRYRSPAASASSATPTRR